MGLLGEFELPSSGEIPLEKPLETRYLRIIPTASSDGSATDAPMAINAVSFDGCRPMTANLSIAPECFNDDRPPAVHAERYFRSFAVDEINDVVYFCDSRFSEPAGPARCFASNRATDGDFDGNFR